MSTVCLWLVGALQVIGVASGEVKAQILTEAGACGGGEAVEKRNFVEQDERLAAKRGMAFDIAS